MKKKHMLLELPEQGEAFQKIISDEKHDVKNVLMTSATVNGVVKHFVLVVWHDEEYGDHMF